jgi:protocatechuate 4,5-dioxygenase alpha chain
LGLIGTHPGDCCNGALESKTEYENGSGMADRNEFDDIPGTYLFDRHRSRQGYHLNMFYFSLMKPENREAFLANETGYLKRFPMSDAQRKAVLERDWLGMIKLGGNIYYMSKLGATLGRSFQYMAGAMSGMTQEEYAAMMKAGGRSIEGNRSRSGRY